MPFVVAMVNSMCVASASALTGRFAFPEYFSNSHVRCYSYAMMSRAVEVLHLLGLSTRLPCPWLKPVLA
eukprot:8427779-Alexandrium_andersonii.AAC.1